MATSCTTAKSPLGSSKLTAVEVARLSAEERGKDFSDQVFIVTGANAGLGYETARALVSQNATVILACRNAESGEEAARRLNDEFCKRTKQAEEDGSLSASGADLAHSMPCDLADFDSIRHFAKTFDESKRPLHGLVNNAGQWLGEERRTKQGFEGTWGVNHLGHFLLTNLLLHKLKASAPSRVVTVSSGLHKRGEFNDDYPVREYPNYGASAGARFYRDSKFMNVLFSNKLHRMLQGTGVTSYACEPGFIPGSSLFRNMTVPGFLWKIMNFFTKSVEQGASTQVYCALYPPVVEDAGKFFANCKVEPAKASTADVALQDKLWTMSEELTELTFPPSEEFLANSTPEVSAGELTPSGEPVVALDGSDSV